MTLFLKDKVIYCPVILLLITLTLPFSYVAKPSTWSLIVTTVVELLTIWTFFDTLVLVSVRDDELVIRKIFCKPDVIKRSKAELRPSISAMSGIVHGTLSLTLYCTVGSLLAGSYASAHQRAARLAQKICTHLDIPFLEREFVVGVVEKEADAISTRGKKMALIWMVGGLLVAATISVIGFFYFS